MKVSNITPIMMIDNAKKVRVVEVPIMFSKLIHDNPEVRKRVFVLKASNSV